jgi:hypothetical protein
MGFFDTQNPGIGGLDELTTSEELVVQQIAALADPNADRILFWDDSASAYKHLTAGSGLTITDTTISASAGTGDVVKVGTPVNNQVGVWTGDGTLEGDAALTFDTTTDTLSTGAIAILGASGAGYASFATQASDPSTPASGTVKLFAADTPGGITRLEMMTSTGAALSFFRDAVTTVRNETGSTISKGKAVYINGANGTTSTVALAQANAASTSADIGLAIANISNNAYGTVQRAGIIRGVDTSAWTAGDTLWLSDSVSGGLTNVEPAAPNFGMKVGTVILSSVSGSIDLFIQPFVASKNYGDFGTLHSTSMTASELAATDASKNIVSLPVASYPSLAEVAHVKGVTSAIQTQLNGKQASLGFTAEDVANKSTDTSLGTSDTLYPSQKAVKTYVDAIAQGLSVKGSVLLATAAALPANTYLAGVITITATGTLTVDGTVTALNDRILVKDESAQLENGIYKVTTAGAIGVAAVLTRSTDMDIAAEFPGAFVFVESGTVNTAAGFVCTNSTAPTVGTDAINWTQFSGAGEITAGAALTKSGNTLDVAVDGSSIEVSGDALRVKASGITSSMLAGTIDATKIADGTVTNAEFQYIGGLTSDAQTQITSKQAALISGTNIKTVNGTTLLGSGDLVIGGGDVTKVGTPANNQIGVWTGDGTLEGDSSFIFNTADAGFGKLLTIGAGDSSDGSFDGAILLKAYTGPTNSKNTYLIAGPSTASDSTIIFPGVSGTLATLAGTETFTNKTLTTPVINGLPTGTGVASAATASTLVSRDANANISADNFLEGYTTTVTAAGTTVLATTSTQQQYFTGTTTQGVTLPSASTIVIGTTYFIRNDSTGLVTVFTNDGQSIHILAGSTAATFTCISNTINAVASFKVIYDDNGTASGKKLTVSNTITLAGTDGTTMTFPTTSATLARIDAANTFTGTNTFDTLQTNALKVAGTVSSYQVIAAGSTGASTVTLPSATSTLATLALAETLTNKTIGAGTLTLAENASIALDPAGSADGKYSGITVTGTAGYTQAFGDLVYLDPTDSRWEAADADVSTAADGDPRGMLAMVVSAGTDGNACTLLLQGIIRADAKFPALTINGAVYVGETAGAIQTTIPTGADNIIRVVGFALTADEIYFNPSPNHQVTVA